MKSRLEKLVEEKKINPHTEEFHKLIVGDQPSGRGKHSSPLLKCGLYIGTSFQGTQYGKEKRE